MALIRAIVANLAGTFLILGLAAWFVVDSAPRAEAANPKCKAGEVAASWYGKESGDHTATGAPFNGSSLTAAMPSRKHLGEHYRVTFRGRSVVVLINDTGGFAKYGRAIDLSREAARRLGMIAVGVGCVKVERL